MAVPCPLLVADTFMSLLVWPISFRPLSGGSLYSMTSLKGSGSLANCSSLWMRTRSIPK
jgi:hypothetical protein